MFTGKYLLKRGIKVNLTKSAFNFKCFSEKKVTNKLSFIDKIKEKFSIKPEEKIKYGELKNRNEEADNHKATRLENEDDLEEGISKFEDSSFSSPTNVTLDIERINVDTIVIEKKIVDKEVIKGNCLQILQLKYKVKIENFSPYVNELYKEMNYYEVLGPRIEELVKLGFSDFNIRILVQKS